MVVISFKNWETALEECETLGRLEPRRHQITIRWYLGRLKWESLPATVKTARWFVEEALEQRNPSAAAAVVFQPGWKDILMEGNQIVGPTREVQWKR